MIEKDEIEIDLVKFGKILWAKKAICQGLVLFCIVGSVVIWLVKGQPSVMFQSTMHVGVMETGLVKNKNLATVIKSDAVRKSMKPEPGTLKTVAGLTGLPENEVLELAEGSGGKADITAKAEADGLLVSALAGSPEEAKLALDVLRVHFLLYVHEQNSKKLTDPRVIEAKEVADGAMAELATYATQVNYPVQVAFVPGADVRYNELYANWSEKQAEYEFFANRLRELRYNKFIAVETEEPTLPQTQQSVLKSPLFRFISGGMIVGMFFVLLYGLWEYRKMEK